MKIQSASHQKKKPTDDNDGKRLRSYHQSSEIIELTKPINLN